MPSPVAINDIDNSGPPVPVFDNSTYNLTQLGTIDWAHWTGTDNDGNNAVMVSKSGGSGISNVSPVGSSGYYDTYTDDVEEVQLAWTDGTGISGLNYDQTKLYQNADYDMYGAAGWSFTVPAGTTAQTLYVLTGGSGAQISINAHLSDSSASDYNDTDSSTDFFRDLYKIDYAAASASQTLTITLTKTANDGDPGGSVDLVGVWLTDYVTPAAPAAPSGVHAMTVSGTQVDLTWQDNSDNEGGFLVDYSTDDTFLSGVTTLVAGADTGSKWITGLTPGDTYYFRVSATNSSGASDPSDYVTAVTPSAGSVITVSGFTRADIIDAIDASSAGDTIFFPAGTYDIDTIISSGDLSVPMGEGRVYEGETTLATGSDGTTETDDESIFVSTGTDPDEPSDKVNAIFDIDENRSEEDPATSYNIKFTNLTFEGRGFVMDTESPIEGVVIEDCHFEVPSPSGNHNDAIAFTTGLANSSIINNVFSGGEISIYGFGWDHLTIANNEFVDGNEGIQLSGGGSFGFGDQSSYYLLLEQNYFADLTDKGIELLDGGVNTIVQDNYYQYFGEEGYVDGTFAYSLPMPYAVDSTVRRNFAIADTISSNADNFDFVQYMYELGGENLNAYDNYSYGGNDIEVNGADASGAVHDNQFVNNYELDGDNTGTGAHATITNNNSDAQLSWDTNRPIPGPFRRVWGLAIDSGNITVEGTPLADSVAVTTDSGELTLTLNGEPFEYPAASVGVVQFVSGKHLSSLSVGDGATVADAAHDTPNDPAGTLIVDSLSIASGGVLDLTNNSMIINYTSGGSTLTDDIRLYMLDGLLLTSATDPSGTTLGYGDNAVLGKTTFAGFTVSSDCVLVKFTYEGDVNLDGRVDVADLLAVGEHYNDASGQVWTSGDFNYDGAVNYTDLTILSAHWEDGVDSETLIVGHGDDDGGFSDGISGLGLSDDQVQSLLDNLGSDSGGPTL